MSREKVSYDDGINKKKGREAGTQSIIGVSAGAIVAAIMKAVFNLLETQVGFSFPPEIENSITGTVCAVVVFLVSGEVKKVSNRKKLGLSRKGYRALKRELRKQKK